MADLTYKELESGYTLIRGDGPCEYWQGMLGVTAVDEGFGPEASEGFRREVIRLLVIGDDEL